METDREETIMYLRKIFHYLGENCKQLNSIKMIFMQTASAFEMNSKILKASEPFFQKVATDSIHLNGITLENYASEEVI